MKQNDITKRSVITERFEGVSVVTLILAGTNEENFYEKLKLFLDEEYKKVSHGNNPRG